MNTPTALESITIRSELRPGDIGYLIYLHADLYYREYNYGIDFECYVAAGLVEFYNQYDPASQRVWICEHHNKMIGFMLLMNRGEAAQLRYFVIRREYRGIGLGKKLMDLFMDFFRARGYKSAYLWTTNEQSLALQLYKNYGFKLTEEKPSTAFGRPLTEQRYDLVL